MAAGLPLEIFAPILAVLKAQQTISGTVEDSTSSPLAREVRLYRYEEFMFDITSTSPARVPYDTTTSNPTSGAFSFTVPADSVQEWVVVCVGEDGENVMAHHRVKVTG